MAAQVLNIEIGKRITKICVSEKKGKSFAITDSFIISTPDGAVVDGQVISEISLGDALKQALSEKNIAATEAYFTVASTKIVSRDVTLPNAKDEQIKSIVATNAGDYFPIDIEKYTIDTVVLERSNDECRALVVAVPNIIVESYINLADYMGISMGALDYCANSQYQVLKSISGEDVDMFINVDADSTSVIFSENGKLLMHRSLAFGGDDMICRYMAANEIPEAEYLRALSELNVDEKTKDGEEDDGTAEKPEIDVDGDIGLSAALGRLVGSITRSLDFFRNGSFGEKAIARVVIMGSCGHLAGLKDKIAASLGFDTSYLEDLEDIQGLANSIGDISIYIGCLGSRLAPMNFLPKDYVKKHGTKKGTVNGDNFGYVAVIAAAFIAILLCSVPGIKCIVSSSKLKKTEKEIAVYQYCEDEYKTYANYTKGDKDLQAFVDSSYTNNSRLKAFFEELEAKMPTNITVLSASCTNESVSMNITVPSFKEAAETLRQLRTFETIDVITCSAMSKGGDDKASLVSFSVNCAYVVEEVPASAEAETASAAE